MKFHLNFIPKPSSFKIDHQSKILLYGSCFSDNIGDLLEKHQFKTLINPEGLFFNPTSLADSLMAVIEQKSIDKKLLVKRDSIFVSYLHHSRIWAEDPERLCRLITTKKQETAAFLKEAGYLVITFGTAHIYMLIDQEKVVANCHKQPSTLFKKSLLKVEEIVEKYRRLISELKIFNPGLKIIFTISPVKYLKDGVEENTISKATLCLAVNQIVKENEQCFYFPAYELVADDLRDYRFYKPDLAHPNELAIEYVWQKFSGCFFSEQTILKNNEIAKINRNTAHRTLHSKNNTDKN